MGTVLLHYNPENQYHFSSQKTQRIPFPGQKNLQKQENSVGLAASYYVGKREKQGD